MTFPNGETVTRLRATETVDQYNSSTWDWSNPEATDIDGWGIAQNASSEPVEEDRESVRSDFTLYRDQPADVLATDRLVIDGLTCKVDGHPATWRHPMTGWAAGFVVRASVVEG